MLSLNCDDKPLIDVVSTGEAWETRNKKEDRWYFIANSIGSAKNMEQKAEQIKKSEAGEGRFRQFKGPLAKIVTIIAVVFTIYELLYAFGFLTTARFLLHTTQHACITLALLLILTFLWIPSRKGASRDKVPWYDIFFIIVSIGGSSYVAINFLEITESSGIPTVFELVLGLLLTLAILEATRRTLGMTLLVLLIVFFFYPLLCNYLPEPFWGKGYSWDRLVGAIYLYPDGIFGLPLKAISKVVAVFIIFASFLRIFRADEFFLNLSLAIAGHFRGGPAKVAVIASSLFGTISGSASANVATTGMITIPLMKKTGQSPAFAGGVEATASIGGQIMPPVMGAVAFLIADFLDLPYIAVCAAAAIPAILYYVAAFLTIDAEARKKRLTGLPKKELPSLSKTLKSGWIFVFPIIILLYALIFLHYTAQLSCAMSFAALLLVCLLRKETRARYTVHNMINGARAGAHGMIQIGIICGGVGIIVGGLTLTGMPLRLSGILTDLAGGHLFPLLLLAAITSLILGMGLPGVACYILLVILAAPALINLGVDPLAAHLFVFYFGVAHFITPPVALAAYVAAGISGASMWHTAFHAMRLGIVVYMIPFVFVYEPALLLKGSFVSIVIAISAAFFGVLGLASALAGYLVTKAHWIQRILLAGGGILLFLVDLEFRIAGAIIIAMIAMWQVIISRRFQRKTQTVIPD